MSLLFTFDLFAVEKLCLALFQKEICDELNDIERVLWRFVTKDGKGNYSGLLGQSLAQRGQI